MGKVSKKKFKAGLESLFTETTEAFLHETVALVDEKGGPQKKAKKTLRIKGKGSSKNFTSDLDSLLEEALSESDDNRFEQKEAKGSFEQKTKRRTVTISGLDALIRKTIDVKFEDQNTSPGTKRVTISVEKEKLQKLKRIARIEKSYLKDIMGDLIAQYIKKYDYDNF